jgi:hypothetical protein
MARFMLRSFMGNYRISFNTMVKPISIFTIGKLLNFTVLLPAV